MSPKSTRMALGLLFALLLAQPVLKSQDVILQGFYWNTNPGDITSNSGVWWDTIAGIAPYLQNTGFATVWTPPANKGFGNVYDMGYGVYDYYDFGEYNQKGSTRTRHGNKAQLQSMISALHSNGIKVMADLVLNHRGGGDALEPEDCNDGVNPTDAWTDFNPASGRLPMDAADFHPNFTHCDVFAPYHDRLFFEDLCYFNFLDQTLDPPVNDWYFGPHNLGRAGDSLIVWGRYLLDEVGFDEVRLDAVKHIEPGFLAPFLVELATPNQPFAVGELFDGNLGTLVNYRNEVENFVSNYGIGSKDANLAIFDFNLRYALRDMCNGGGAFQMHTLNSTGLYFGGGLPGEDVVTFVENHDVDRIGWQVVNCPGSYQVGSTCMQLYTDGGHDPIISDKEDMGYPYIMAAEGRPTVFWKDLFWYGLKEDIEWQMALRDAMAKGTGVRGWNLGSFSPGADSTDVFAMARYGNSGGVNDGMVLVLNDNPGSERSVWVNTPFTNKYLKDYSDGYMFVTTQSFADTRANVKAQSRDYGWWSVTGLYPKLPGTTGSHFQMDAEPGGCPHFIALRAADAANLLVNGAPIAAGDQVAVKNGAGDIVGIGRIGQGFQWDGVHDMVIEVLGAPSANGMSNGEQFSFVVYDASANAEVTIGYVQYATAGSGFTFSPDRPDSPNRNGNFSTFNLTATATGLYTCGGITQVLAFGLPVVPLEEQCGAPSLANATTYDDGLQNGDNDGSRFGVWTGVNGGGNAGFFMGDSRSNGDGDDDNGDGDINTSNRAWGFWANSGATAEATRPFASALTAGQTFSMEMDNGYIQTGGTVGLVLQNGSGNKVWEFYFVGGSTSYTINDGIGANGTGISFTDEGLALEFLLTSSTTYRLKVTKLFDGTVSTFTGDLITTSPGGFVIQGVRLFNANAGGGGSNDAFFNSMQICDPPALVINEADYDQPGDDMQEFIELRNMNTTSLNLNGFVLELVNGGDNSVYRTVTLPNANLSAGDYFVICANGSSVPNCDFNFDGSQSDRIQNGAPDGMRLLWNGVTIDALSYEGSVSGAVEGSGAGLTDNNVTSDVGLSRVPDGSDTDQNNVDFELACITPGAANAPDNTDTDNDGAPDGCDDCPLAQNQGTIPNFDLAECACNQGYYAVYGTENGQQVITGCQPCPPGTFCPDGLNAYPCQPGEYSSVSGAASCQNCPSGTYSGVLGATYCETCEPGSEAPSQGSSSCENCDPPSFSSCPVVTPVNSTSGQCDALVTVPMPVLSGLCTRNHALHFDGSNDIVNLGAPLLPTTANTPFSIEAWIRTTDGDGVIVAQYDQNSSQRFRFFIQNGKLNYLRGNDPYASSTATVSDGQWHHVAVTRNSSGAINLYIDGVLDGTGTDNTGFINDATRIGAIIFDGAPSRPFTGEIDEVRIWNVARAQADIQAAMNLEINPTYAGLAAFYNFNEGIACCDNPGLTTLPNGMGANDGALSGFSLASGCTSNWVAGAPALGDPLTLVNDVTGNCSSASGTYPVGTTSVTWTATGANGQTATCVQTVTVQSPEILVEGNGQEIANGDNSPSTTDHTDFDGNLSRMFTIQNTGAAALTVSSITSSNPKFVIGALSPGSTVAASGSATFTVTYNPTDATVQTATITVNSDDCDEAAYDFAVTAAAAPILGVYPAATVIAGQNVTVTPDAAPVGATQMTVAANTNFTGVLTANPATGVVSVIDAKQAGTYTVTVTAFNGNGSSTATFTLTVTDPESCQALFGGTTSVPALSGAHSIGIGDFDGDGIQDLATANFNTSFVSIRLGDGSGGFSGSTNITTGTGAIAVAVGDFNGDGHQDFAAANYSVNSVSIRLGDGAGGFSGSTNVSVGASPTALAIGDFNGDGKQDFVTANRFANSASIRLGDGAGGFSGSTEVAAGANPRGVTVGDFNGDGKQDLAVANNGTNTVSICLGDGVGGFGSATNITVGNAPYGVATGDFNEDGFQDLAVANGNSNTVSIRLGDGLGGFSGSANLAVGTQPWLVAVGDFNGDGHQDFAAANGGSGTVSIYLGDGLGNFSFSANWSMGSAPRWVAVGDFNSDGKQDLVASNFITSGTLTVRLGVNNEINVQGNGMDIADGDNTPSSADHTDFDGAFSRTFTIQNTDEAVLTISGIVSDNAKFVVSGAPATVAANSSATFSVTYNPTGSGAEIATITVNSDDCDEAAYDFAVTASCEPPVFSACPATPVTVNLDAGQCTAVANYTVTATGSPTPTLSYTFAGATTGSGSGTGSGAVFNKGNTTVTVTATNGCVSQATCVFTVTVADSEAPVLSCPAAIVQNNDAGQCTATVTVPVPGFTDNCATNQALFFDGVNDYVDMGDVTTYDGLKTVTFESWVYVDNVDVGERFGIIGKNTTTLRNWALYTSGDRVGFYAAENGGSNDVTLGSNPVLTAGTWHHVAISLDLRFSGSEVIQVYVDGVLIPFTVDIDGSGWPNNGFVNNTAPLRLGYLDYGSISYGHGRLDEIRVWNFVRSQAAIQATMSQELTGNETGLIAYYNFNEGVTCGANPGVTTLPDLSSSAINGTLTNFALTGAGPNPCESNWACGAPVPNVPLTNDYTNTCNASGIYPVGNTVITWTGRDASGNTATCQQTVTVVDNEAPTLANPGPQNLNTDSGLCTANYTIADPVSDNCTSATWGYTLTGATTGTVTGIADGTGSGALSFNKGVTTVELSATDGTNSAATVSFTVTVTDNQMPTITCPANIVANTGVNTTTCTSLINEPVDLLTLPGVVFPNGPVPASGTSLLFPSSDPPNQIMIKIPVIPAGLFQTGDEITLSFSSSWTRNGLDNDVRWMFADGDQLHLNGIFLIDNGDGAVARSQAASSPGATIAAFNLDNSISCGSCFPSVGGQYGADVTLNVNALGQVTISGVMFGGGSGNTAVFNYSYTGTFDVAKGINFLFVNENSVGGASTQLDELDYTCDLATPSPCGAIVSWNSPAGSDNCSVVVTRSAGPGNNANTNLNSGDEFPLGVTTVCYQAEDGSGNSSECCFTVTVNDNSNPDITCPAAVVAYTVPGDCTATSVVLGAPTASDNCGAPNISNNAPPAFPKGLTTVIWTAADASGNTATCTQTVTVIDNQPPAITCPSNISVNNDPGQCCAVVNYTAPTGTDNCTGQSTAQTAGEASGFCFPVGVTTNTFVVTDAANLTASCSFTVTVQTPEMLVEGNNQEIADGDNSPSATDDTDFGDQTVGSMTDHTFTILNSGTTTLNLTGNPIVAISGDSEFSVFTQPSGASIAPGDNLTFVVRYAPTAAGSHTATVSIANDDCDENPYTFDVLGEVLCDISITSVTPTDEVCPGANDGTITVVAVCNSCGSSSDIRYSISPDPNSVSPQVSNVFTNLPDGAYTITVYDVNDNTCTDSDGPHTVAAGVDTEDPTVGCPGAQTANTSDDVPGDCSTVISGLQATGADNCTVAGNLEFTYSVSGATTQASANAAGSPLDLSGIAFNTGVSTVNVSVTDEASNTSTTCSFMVTVSDDEDPTPVCNNITVQLDAAGNASIPVTNSQVTIFSEDFSSDPDASPTTTLTNWNVIFGNIDVSNYISNIHSPGREIDLAGLVNGKIETKNTFTLTPGTYQFSFVHQTNTYPNNAMKVTIGTVYNNTFPAPASATAVSETFTVNTTTTVSIVLEEVGPSNNGGTFIGSILLAQLVIPASIVDGGSSDNCGIASISVNISDFTCDDVGQNTVTLTVTDEATNSATCEATVTVEDVTPPVPPANGSSTVTCPALAVAPVTPQAADVCDGNIDAILVSVVDNPDPLTCEGTRVYTYSYTDASNNSSQWTYTYTIDNNTPPVITLLGDASLVICKGAAFSDAGATASDDCQGDITGSIVAVNPVNTAVAGVYTVTYNVSDCANNAATEVTRTVEVVDPQMPSASAMSDEFCSGGTSPITVSYGADTDKLRVDVAVMQGAPTGYTPSPYYLSNGAQLEANALNNIVNQDAILEYTITPYHYGPNGQDDQAGGDDCTGPVKVVTITIKPEPVGANKTYKVCSGTSLSIDLQGLVDTDGNGVASTFSWVAANNAEVDGENSLPTAGSVINNQLSLVVPANGVKTVVYTVSPTGQNGCAGDDFTITVEVHPCEVTIIDPCACLDNATTLSDGQFSETVEVTGPSGDSWTVVLAPGLYLAGSPAPPAAPLPVPAGTVLAEDLPGNPGSYLLQGVHVDALGYSISVTNGSVTLSVSNTCYYPNPSLSGLSATYCSQDGPQAVAVTADLGDASGTATVENILFELIRQSDNAVVATQSGLSDTFNFDPSTLAQGQYTLRATFDAAYDAAIHPGCVQEVEEEFEVRKVGCGTFPWDGN